MKKTLTLLSVVSAFTVWDSAIEIHKMYSRQGLVFTVTHSTTGVQTNLFGNSYERCLVWATSGASGEIYEFNLPKNEKMSTGEKFTVSFHRIVPVDKKTTF